MDKEKKNQIFVSYAHEDVEIVKIIVFGLKKRGLEVWFDKENLTPGRWKTQIIKEITRSRYFLLCISEQTLRKTGDKPGFQDEELNTAYEIAQAQADHQFTIVPVRLEDCERGDFRITSFQQYDLFPDIEKGLDKLAVHIGGVSLSDATVQDERSEDEKIIDSLLGKAVSLLYAKDLKKALTIYNSVLAMDPNNSEASNNIEIVHRELGYRKKAIELNSDDAVDGIEPEPPSFIKNIKWFLLFWRKSLKYIIIGVIIIALYAILSYRGELSKFYFPKSPKKQTTLEPATQEKSPSTSSKATRPPADQKKEEQFNNIKTFVGGIIDRDTIWGIAGSPYMLNGPIEVGKGIALTIEPGVKVYGGQGHDANNIRLFGGEFIAIGTNTLKIVLNNLQITGKTETNVKINIRFAKIENSYLYCRWADSFSLSNSIIKGGLGTGNIIEITPLFQDSYIERNVFIGNGKSNFIDAGNASKSGNLYIKNNVFYDPRDYAVRCGFNTVFKYNSFFDTNKFGIVLSSSTDFNATNNFWNTEDHNVVNSMIKDNNDTLSISGKVNYLPILIKPHADTPEYMNDQQNIIKFNQNKTTKQSGSESDEATIKKQRERRLKIEQQSDELAAKCELRWNPAQDYILKIFDIEIQKKLNKGYITKVEPMDSPTVVAEKKGIQVVLRRCIFSDKSELRVLQHPGRVVSGQLQRYFEIEIWFYRRNYPNERLFYFFFYLDETQAGSSDPDINVPKIKMSKKPMEDKDFLEIVQMAIKKSINLSVARSNVDLKSG